MKSIIDNDNGWLLCEGFVSRSENPSLSSEKVIIIHYKSKLTEDIGLDRRITGEKLVFEDAVCWHHFLKATR